MSDSSNGCIFVGLLYSATLAVFVGSGFLAWEWIEPDSFGETIIFLIVWGLLAWGGRLVVGGIIYGIASLLD